MNSIVVYSTGNTTRLQYVLDWLSKQLSIDYAIVTDESELHHIPFFISYGKHFLNALSIPDAGLLMETDVKEKAIPADAWYGIPTLYASKGEDFTLPFDLFSAIFFLLSRYEEYYPFTPDKHGRYPAEQSILYRNGWLQRPLIDEWVQQLRITLQQQFGQEISMPSFSYQLSYDIDIAYSYLNKGFIRGAGALLKNLAMGKIRELNDRTAVLLHRKKDPYDSFTWLQQLHRQHPRPLYFILSAEKTTPYDKNISPRHTEMKRLVKQLAADGKVGIHPSYFSNEGDIMRSEKKILEKTIGNDITISRQHYIRVMLPDTYHLLMQNKITDDYSMGYGTHIGFRAGTGKSFFWYDLKNEAISTLRVHPFCFMDTTAHFEEKLPAFEAFERLTVMTRKLQQTNSRLTIIFHNFSLGKSREWRGWRRKYEHFLEELGKIHESHSV